MVSTQSPVPVASPVQQGQKGRMFPGYEVCVGMNDVLRVRSGWEHFSVLRCPSTWQDSSAGTQPLLPLFSWADLGEHWEAHTAMPVSGPSSLSWRVRKCLSALGLAWLPNARA